MLDNFTARNVLDQFPIGFQEIVFEELVARRPLHRFEDLVGNLSSIGRNREENNFHKTVRIAMAQSPNFLADLRVNPQFLRELAAQRILHALAVAHFAAGEFPLQPVGIGSTPLANEEPVRIEQNAGSHQDGR